MDLPRMSSPTTSGRRGDRFTTTLVSLALFVVVVALQWRSGAYQSEFGATDDEAAHVITGLMVHDYLFGPAWSGPMRFAQNYYVHYPKVALGHWPPFFYMVQTAWIAVVGDNRVSLILLMAALCTTLAVMIYRVALRNWGPPLAVSAAAVFVLLPLVQKYTACVMTEVLQALLTFSAAVAFTRYLESARAYRWSLAFALLASLAILTKGTGLLLALAPPFALLFARRFECLGRPSLWLSPAVVALACMPFYLLTLNMQRNGMAYESFTASYVPIAAQFYGTSLVKCSTLGVFSLAMIGIADCVILPQWRGSGAKPIFAAMGSMLFSVWAFHAIVPAGLEPRHLLPALPPIVIFMAAGLSCLLRRYTGPTPHPASRGVEAFACVLAIASVMALTEPYYKNWYGYGDVVRDLDRGTKRQSVVMVSSDPPGEGALISEAALNDRRRPGRYFLRASKMLAKDRWSGADYKVQFGSPAEIMAALEKIPVNVLLIDTSVDPTRTPRHHRQLLSMVEMFPQRWCLQGRRPFTRNGIEHREALCLYTLEGLDPATVGQIEVDMETMLGQVIRSGDSNRNGGP